MTIIILNDDQTIHHIRRDSTGDVYPCYSIGRTLNPKTAKGVGVYTFSDEEMTQLQKAILTQRDGPNQHNS